MPRVRLLLRRKLRAITIAAAVAAVFLACGSFVAYDLATFRGAMLQELSTKAEIIARQGTAILLNRDSARAVLEVFTDEPHVVSAAIYTTDGSLVASYLRRGTSGPPPRPAAGQGAGHMFASGRLVVFRAIESDFGIIGNVMIESDLTALTGHLQRYALIALCVLVVSFLVAHWTASRLERVIAGSVQHLVVAADAVSTQKDYSVRAAVERRDKLGQLTLAFNHMLDEVQAHESALQASEEKYRLLFDANPNPMWLYDANTLAFLAVNQAAVRQYGYSRDEFLVMTMQEIRPQTDAPVLLDQPQEPADGPRLHGLWRHRRKDGSTLDVEVESSAIVLGGVAARLEMATDVSEKKRLEAQLAQAQKMEAIGRLAGGVAHDFNNILSVITGYAELLRKHLRSQDASQKRVEQIQKAAERAAALTRQLLAFSRKEVIQPKVLDLNQILAEVAKMLGRLIGEDVHLVTKPGKDLGHVQADRGQIDQIILNLAVNARDAMPRGGDLLIETSNVVLDEGYLRTHTDVRPGPYVLLTVSDTGHGMKAETLSHIFEPFFTTKAEGKGTGLGLAIVFGIVKDSGGHVSVHSEPGRGTTVSVYLPRVDAGASANEAPAVIAPPPRGTETVLLVEDAEALRPMIHEILDAAGYSVLESSDPEEAVLRASSYDGPLDLVLTDVVMPHMSGPDLVKAVQAARPSVKVLFMSGYTNEAIGRQGVLEPGVHFLQKPFTSEALLGSVRVALDQGGQRA